MRREAENVIDGENHLIVVVAALPEGADVDAFRRRSEELGKEFGGYASVGRHAVPPAFTLDGRVRCPKCGNDDPAFFKLVYMTEGSHRVVTATRDEVGVVAGRPANEGSADLYDVFWCGKDLCGADFTWPHNSVSKTVHSGASG